MILDKRIIAESLIDPLQSRSKSDSNTGLRPLTGNTEVCRIDSLDQPSSS